MEEYESFKNFRLQIERNVDIDEIEEAIEKVKTNNLSMNIYRELIFYVKAFVMAVKYKNYNRSITYCLRAFNTDVELFKLNKIEKY